jgi:hypothetical protein
VWEWCEDWYGAYAKDDVDPRGPAASHERVVRGGGWNSRAGHCRSAFRFRWRPGVHLVNFGFRFAAGQSGVSGAARLEAESEQAGRSPAASSDARGEGFIAPLSETRLRYFESDPAGCGHPTSTDLRELVRGYRLAQAWQEAAGRLGCGSPRYLTRIVQGMKDCEVEKLARDFAVQGAPGASPEDHFESAELFLKARQERRERLAEARLKASVGDST